MRDVITANGSGIHFPIRVSGINAVVRRDRASAMILSDSKKFDGCRSSDEAPQVIENKKVLGTAPQRFFKFCEFGPVKRFTLIYGLYDLIIDRAAVELSHTFLCVIH